MRYYIYKLKDNSGNTLNGIAEASSKNALKQKLRKTNYYVISIHTTKKSRIFNSKVNLECLLMFTHRLTSLIESGIPILSALQILWRQTEEKTLQWVISHLQYNLEKGNGMVDALEDFPHAFPLIYRSMIRIAEKTGKFVIVLKSLTKYLHYQRTFRIRIKKATIYPAIVISFSILVLIGMFYFVVPVFQQVLIKLKVELPLITRLILQFSQALNSWYIVPAIILLLGGLWSAWKFIRSIPMMAKQIDRWILKIPIVGHIIYTISISRFIHALSLLLGSGINIVDSFQAAKSTTRNQSIINGIDQVEDQLKEGESIHEAFRQAKIFPVMLVEMVGIGETSGTIVKTFENLAIHLDEEVDYYLSKLLIMMEPLLIIIVGAIVTVTLLAIYMPVFTIWESLMR